MGFYSTHTHTHTHTQTHAVREAQSLSAHQITLHFLHSPEGAAEYSKGREAAGGGEPQGAPALYAGGGGACGSTAARTSAVSVPHSAARRACIGPWMAGSNSHASDRKSNGADTGSLLACIRCLVAAGHGASRPAFARAARPRPTTARHSPPPPATPGHSPPRLLDLCVSSAPLVQRRVGAAVSMPAPEAGDRGSNPPPANFFFAVGAVGANVGSRRRRRVRQLQQQPRPPRARCRRRAPGVSGRHDTR